MAFATYIVGQTPFPEFSVILMLDDVTDADQALYIKKHLNHTDGVHVHQRVSGCELLNNDKPGLIQTWDAFDGQNVGKTIFDIEKHEVQTKLTWMPWDQLKKLQMKVLYENVYHPLCIKVLRRYLNLEKNNVMRKVKPRVRFMRNPLTDSQRLQISCLATGFYPRHINLTLFRDGQPVDVKRQAAGKCSVQPTSVQDET
uniref:Immunoglobulin C1-set domain-containing protein n=1 Tax=Sinocyclocheilus grahami TaxID=75366 RepID=A0A672QF25_SINGR